VALLAPSSCRLGANGAGNCIADDVGRPPAAVNPGAFRPTHRCIAWRTDGCKEGRRYGKGVLEAGRRFDAGQWLSVSFPCLSTRTPGEWTNEGERLAGHGMGRSSFLAPVGGIDRDLELPNLPCIYQSVSQTAVQALGWGAA